MGDIEKTKNIIKTIWVVLDSLRLFYGPSGSDKYYNSNEGKFLGFSRLRKNFQTMTSELLNIKKYSFFYFDWFWCYTSRYIFSYYLSFVN